MKAMITAAALLAAGLSATGATAQDATPNTGQPTAQSRAATTPAAVQGKSLGGTASMHQLKADEHTRAAMASTGMTRVKHHRMAAAELRKAADLHERAAKAAEGAVNGR